MSISKNHDIPNEFGDVQRSNGFKETMELHVGQYHPKLNSCNLDTIRNSQDNDRTIPVIISKRDYWESPYHDSGEPIRTQSSQSNDQIEIGSTRNDAIILIKQIHSFQGSNEEDKSFRYIDEMLTRCILRLDNIEPSDSEVRIERKQTINHINQAISILERRMILNSQILEIERHLNHWSDVIETQPERLPPEIVQHMDTANENDQYQRSDCDS